MTNVAHSLQKSSRASCLPVNKCISNAVRAESFAPLSSKILHAVRGQSLKRRLKAGLKTGRRVSLRGAVGDEAISFTDKDCFAPLAMTSYPEFADTLFVVERKFITHRVMKCLPVSRIRFPTHRVGNFSGGHQARVKEFATRCVANRESCWRCPNRRPTGKRKFVEK